MEPVRINHVIFCPANIAITCEHLVYVQGDPDCLSPSVLPNFLPRPDLSYQVHRRHPEDPYIFLEMEQVGEAIWLSKKKRLRYGDKEIRMRGLLHPEYHWQALEHFVDHEAGREVPSIFLKDLPNHYGEMLLRRYFGQFGAIEELRIFPRSDRAKNTGVLRFRTKLSAKTTLFLKHSILASEPHVVIPLLETHFDHYLRRQSPRMTMTSTIPRQRAIPDQIRMRTIPAPRRRFFIRDQESLPIESSNIRFNTLLGVFRHSVPEARAEPDTIPGTKTQVVKTLNFGLSKEQMIDESIQQGAEELPHFLTKPGLRLRTVALLPPPKTGLCLLTNINA